MVDDKEKVLRFTGTFGFIDYIAAIQVGRIGRDSYIGKVPDTLTVAQKKFNTDYTIMIEAGSDCESMFRGCHCLDTRIIFTGDVVSCRYMFDECTSLTNHVDIPVVYTRNGYVGMFNDCIEYNHDVIIPNDTYATTTYCMLSGCHMFKSKIVIQREDIDTDFMFTTNAASYNMREKSAGEEKLWEQFRAE